MFVPPTAPPPSPGRQRALNILLSVTLVYVLIVAGVQLLANNQAPDAPPPLTQVDAEITGLMDCDRGCKTTVVRYQLQGKATSAQVRGKLGQKGESVQVWVDPHHPFVAHAEPWQALKKGTPVWMFLMVPVVPALIICGAMLVPSRPRHRL